MGLAQHRKETLSMTPNDLHELANMYGFLAWLIPTLITFVALVGYCFWISRDRVPRSARRKRGF
jgi:hypothetical protein